MRVVHVAVRFDGAGDSRPLPVGLRGDTPELRAVDGGVIPYIEGFWDAVDGLEEEGGAYAASRTFLGASARIVPCFPDAGVVEDMTANKLDDNEARVEGVEADDAGFVEMVEGRGISAGYGMDGKEIGK